MARPAERFVTSLSEKQQAQLKNLWRTDERHRVRCRAHAVWLSSRSVSITELCTIFDVSRSTVSAWLDRWEESGFDGLEDEDHLRGGRILDDQERQLAQDLLEKHPRRPDRVLEELRQQTGKTISRRTLRRLARAAGLVWKRMRRIVNPVADQRSDRARNKEKHQAKQIISELRQEEAANLIDLYFFDEVGFSLTPAVPYGWQPIGETTSIPSSKGGTVQTLGFMNPQCQLVPYCVDGTITSEIVVQVFDDFVSKLSGPTVVVIDNAPVHTSRLFESRTVEWSASGMEIYALPTYSPELNLIERLWRAIKHRWLPLDAYQSFKHLKARLDETLRIIGSELTLDFSIP